VLRFRALCAVLLSSLLVLGNPAVQAKTVKESSAENRLSIKWDPLTGAPLTMRGKKGPILEIGPTSGLNRAQITRVGPLLVKKYGALLKIRWDQMRLKGAECISGNWYVSYWQTTQGLIIYESSLGFSIDPQGRVVSLGALLYPGVRVPEQVIIDREKALSVAREHVPDFAKADYRLLAESLVIYPDRKAERVDYYKVYAFNFFPQKALHPASVVGGWAVFVDTQTGKVVQRQTLFKPMGCCVPENWTPPKAEEVYKGILGH
jgi:hypothetical protein